MLFFTYYFCYICFFARHGDHTTHHATIAPHHTRHISHSEGSGILDASRRGAMLEGIHMHILGLKGACKGADVLGAIGQSEGSGACQGITIAVRQT